MSRIKNLISDLLTEPEDLKPWNVIDEMMSSDTTMTSLRMALYDELDDEE